MTKDEYIKTINNQEKIKEAAENYLINKKGHYYWEIYFSDDYFRGQGVNHYGESTEIDHSKDCIFRIEEILNDC